MWLNGPAVPKFTVRRIQQAEAEGWHGVGVADTECVSGDPYVIMGAASAVTSSIRLSTAVTNPVTRHPAVTAAAIATVQASSSGRAVLGIGRGDSSLAHVGAAPASVRTFERYLTAVQGYLTGEAVAFDDLDALVPRARRVEELALPGGPTDSRLTWLRQGVPKVPVDVAASGPKVIDLAARVGDSISFAVGADPERLRWAVGRARDAAAAAGRDPDSLDLGVYVGVVAHEDRDEARRLIRGTLASLARFSVMHGRPTGPASHDDIAVLEDVAASYDLRAHFAAGSPQSQVLTDAFIDRFGIAGPPSYCVERILELGELGIRRLSVFEVLAGIDKETIDEMHDLIARAVLPAVA